MKLISNSKSNSIFYRLPAKPAFIAHFPEHIFPQGGIIENPLQFPACISVIRSFGRLYSNFSHSFNSHTIRKEPVFGRCRQL